MFGAIGEVLGGIFGTKKAIENLTDKDDGLLVKAGGFFNDLHYSDQEEARDTQAVREWGIRQLDALAPFKIVQRILAIAATSFWILVGMNVLLAIWVDAIYSTQVTSPMLKFAFSDYVLYPVMSAFVLYFSGGIVNSFKRNP